MGCSSARTSATAAGTAGVAELESHTVGLAGYRFDPLDYERELPADRQVPRHACGGRPCHYVVQFARALQGKERELFQRVHRLGLDRYVPSLAYIEYLDPVRAQRVCDHHLVRACMPFQPAFRLPSGGISLGPAQPQELVALLFHEANMALVRGQMAQAGAQIVNARDDRPLGGSQRIVFRLAEPGHLERLSRIEGLQWIEPAPRVDEDQDG